MYTTCTNPDPTGLVPSSTNQRAGFGGRTSPRDYWRHSPRFFCGSQTCILFVLSLPPAPTWKFWIITCLIQTIIRLFRMELSVFLWHLYKRLLRSCCFCSPPSFMIPILTALSCLLVSGVWLILKGDGICPYWLLPCVTALYHQSYCYCWWSRQILLPTLSSLLVVGMVNAWQQYNTQSIWVMVLTFNCCDSSVYILVCILSGLNNSIGPIARNYPKWPSSNHICGPKLPAKLVFWKFGQQTFSCINQLLTHCTPYALLIWEGFCKVTVT